MGVCWCWNSYLSGDCCLVRFNSKHRSTSYTVIKTDTNTLVLFASKSSEASAMGLLLPSNKTQGHIISEARNFINRLKTDNYMQTRTRKVWISFTYLIWSLGCQVRKTPIKHNGDERETAPKRKPSFLFCQVECRPFHYPQMSLIIHKSINHTQISKLFCKKDVQCKDAKVITQRKCPTLFFPVPYIITSRVDCGDHQRFPV